MDITDEERIALVAFHAEALDRLCRADEMDYIAMEWHIERMALVFKQWKMLLNLKKENHHA